MNSHPSSGSVPPQAIIRTLCGACHNSCGMLVRVVDGQIRSVTGDPEHPMNCGTLCAKGTCMPELVTSPYRLKRPLKRVGARGGSEWEEITWDQALDWMAGTLTEIKTKYGPETLLLSTGAPMMEFQRYGFSEFAAQYGTPNTLASNLCSAPLSMALESVYGFKSQPDYANTKFILIWGANPWASMRPGHNIAYGGKGLLTPVTDAVSRGARLVVVDPVCTETASKAHQWIPIRPGTDGALALAMLNVVIGEGLYDQAFVDKWTVGFDRLKDHVGKYTPEWAAPITDVPAGGIRQLAVEYATTKPATIRWGNAFANHTNVTQALRAGGSLEAITGNLEVPGGNLCFPTELRYKTTVKPATPQVGLDKYPLLPAGPSMLDVILSGKPIQPRALLAFHTNLISHAGYERVKEAIRKLEFVAVVDIFLTRACQEFADLVLPDASFFERYDWRSYPSPKGLYVGLRQPVVEPVGDSRPLYDIELDLAKRMGYGERYPWHSVEELFAYHLGYVGLDLPKLQDQPIQLVNGFEYAKHEKGLLRSDGQPGFRTPSGKVELYSDKFDKLGYEPLPIYHEPAESPVSTPAVAAKYPLIGVNRRSPFYVHFKYRNLTRLRKIEPEPFVRLHPRDAEARGICDGDQTRIRSPRGEIRMKAQVTKRVKPGVVWIDGGWGNSWDFPEANLNVLLDNTQLDPIAQCASLSSFLCQVEKQESKT